MQDSQSLEQAKSFFLSGLEKLNSNNFAGAEVDFESSLRFAPNRLSIIVNLSIVLIKANKLKKAEKIIHEGLVYHPQNKDLLLSLVEIYKRIISFNRSYAEVYVNLGNVYRELNMYEESLTAYNNAIKLKPNLAESYANRGNVLQNLKKYQEALEDYDKAIAIKPDYAEAYSNKGNALKELLIYEEALENQNKAIEIDPNYAEAFFNSGVILAELNRYEQALATYEKAIYKKQNYAEAYYNCGVIFSKLNQLEQALICYEKAFYINPNYAEAYYNHGVTLGELRFFDKALESYNITLELIPNYEYLLGTILHTKMLMCDWQNFEDNVEKMLLKISLGEKASPSFPVLGLSDSLSINRKVSEIEINDKYPFNPSLGIIPKLQLNTKIKLAFLSADFKEHPMGFNFVGFFENIDKNKFEVIAVSFTNITNSPLSRRLASAFDIFKIVDNLNDSEVCKWIRDQKVNIAIDMMGPTQYNRSGIFAMRCAPIQVNQFSWTSSAPYIDYIIADSISIPEEYSYGYTEKLAYVPDTLFATDNKREISIKIPQRSEQNLPEQGVIFCCFNNNFKITPNVFDVWINILKNVPCSVLWIKGGRESLERNLFKEAAKRGLDTNRLVFAGQIPLMQDHLSRYRLADLFLDTFPFCAQTTASDALWAGVPVLTRTGESSMSRICSSILNAIKLPELITTTQAEYEAKAIELGNNPAKIKAIKEKLERNRLTTALFDTPRFTKHIEAAFTQMYERYQADLPPDHIHIDAKS